MSELPIILVIDDQDEVPLSLGADEAVVYYLHPREVNKRDIEDAHIILVDYDLGEWVTNDLAGNSVCAVPSNGLAVASIIRQQTQALRPCPPAIAVLTGQLGNLAGILPAEYRHHALARINNIEWVFEKGQDNNLKIRELALAVLHLKAHWLSINTEQGVSQLLEFLGVSAEDELRADKLADALSCLPPIHDLAEQTSGFALLRWFLHRILPYPCFLMDSYTFAWRLSVSHKDLEKNLSSESQLRTAFAHCEYRGSLSTFLGPRWWRVDVDSTLWQLTKGASYSSAAVREAVQPLMSSIEEAEYPLRDDLVVCLSEKLTPYGKVAPISECVYIRPDDWPPFATPAWAHNDDVANSEFLRSIVLTRKV